jgi:hypothetical protein
MVTKYSIGAQNSPSKIAENAHAPHPGATPRNRLEIEVAKNRRLPVSKTPRKPSLALVSSKTTTVSPPRKLGRTGMSLWTRILSDFTIDDAAGLELLAQAAEAADMLGKLNTAIAEDGPIVRGRNGMRANPLIREALGYKSFITRTLGRLGILSEPLRSPGRPPQAVGWAGPDTD